MKIFLDTAKLGEIKKYSEVIDGVTTNPTLMEKAGMKYTVENIQKVCKAVNGPVSVEAASTTLDHLLYEAVILNSYAKNIVVKIPMTDYGLKAVKDLKKKKVKTNVTLVFSPNQALLAAKAGADYISIFVGRLDDQGIKGMDVVKDSLEALANYDFNSKIIVASVRNVNHVVEAAKLGAPIATVPTKVLEDMYKHELTDKGIEKFLEDYAKLKK